MLYHDLFAAVDRVTGQYTITTLSSVNTVLSLICLCEMYTYLFSSTLAFVVMYIHCFIPGREGNMDLNQGFHHWRKAL
jgi:hypothetical protein